MTQESNYIEEAGFIPESGDGSSPKTVRRSRATDTRIFDTRTSNSRAPIVYGTGSRFNFPADVIQHYKDQGKELAYVVYTSGDSEQKENYYNAIDRRYRPLMASEHPSLARNYSMNPFGDRDDADQFIKCGGQIGMVRDGEYGKIEREFHDSEKNRQEYMASMHRTMEPGRARPFIDERYRERMN